MNFINSINMSLVRQKLGKKSEEEILTACTQLGITPELPISKEDRDKLVQHFIGSGLAKVESQNLSKLVDVSTLDNQSTTENLVTSKAQEFNISLSTDQVKLIAQTIDKTSAIAVLDQIEQALTTYIRHEEARHQQAILGMFSRVVDQETQVRSKTQEIIQNTVVSSVGGLQQQHQSDIKSFNDLLVLMGQGNPSAA